MLILSQAHKTLRNKTTFKTKLINDISKYTEYRFSTHPFLDIYEIEKIIKLNSTNNIV